MDASQFKAALMHHCRTNRLQALDASHRGDFERAKRCTAIADMADKGKLLAPTRQDPSVPDLVAAATALGLLVSPT
jgi:heme oxygenase